MSDRLDIFVELASDQVNLVQDLVYNGNYEELHNWLHPIFLDILKRNFAEVDDKTLRDYYADQLGVDFSNAPNET